jgi:hypothetical protein
MLGEKADPGIVQRSVFDILWQKKQVKQVSEITIWASYYEIINQKINDMLVVGSQDLRIAENQNGSIKGLKVVEIENMNDLKELLLTSQQVSEYRTNTNLDYTN